MNLLRNPKHTHTHNTIPLKCVEKYTVDLFVRGCFFFGKNVTIQPLLNVFNVKTYIQC